MLIGGQTGYGIYGNSLYYFYNFSVNLKLFQNKKFIYKTCPCICR